MGRDLIFTRHMLPIRVWGWGDGVGGGIVMEVLDRRESSVFPPAWLRIRECCHLVEVVVIW